MFIGSDNGYLKLFDVETRVGVSESLIMKQCRNISHICSHPMNASVAVASHVTSYHCDVTSMVIVWKIVGEMVSVFVLVVVVVLVSSLYSIMTYNNDMKLYELYIKF